MAHTVAAVLNDLIETSKDGEEGFRQAAHDTHDAQLKTIFATHAQACAQAVAVLQTEVSRQGGTPETGGSIGATLHRGWMQFKSATMPHDEHGILADVERGEDNAKRHYRDALDHDLPADVRALIEQQYQAVLQTHDQVRNLRDRYASRS